MSSDRITPGGIIIPQNLPTPEETKEKLDDIGNKVSSPNAAMALQELCTTIIRAVTEVDQSHNVGRYLRSVRIVCHGIGDFQLDVETKNTDIDPEEIARAAAAELQGEGGDYGKPLRNIAMGFNTDG